LAGLVVASGKLPATGIGKEIVKKAAAMDSYSGSGYCLSLWFAFQTKLNLHLSKSV
jgi:hypothetical protein